jgi:poly(hydroxyalkanoate) depolymerase family esterase
MEAIMSKTQTNEEATFPIPGRWPGLRGAALRIWAVSALLLGVSLPAVAASPVEVTGFGSNPGRLRMFKYVPDNLPASVPLVVVMHGCTQNARDYTSDSGWIELADEFRFALVMPEQTQANNSRNCFNWFLTSDNRRNRGEAQSIKQMVDKAVADHGIDATKVFVTGLSAGGAMTSVMLATYPEVFNGGGIVAGLPYGCANDSSPQLPLQALNCMSSGNPAGMVSMTGLPNFTLPGLQPTGLPLPSGICFIFFCPPPSNGGDNTLTASELGDFVRDASNHTGRFPRVSIWHGSSDPTVSPVNASEEMLQWTNVHGVNPEEPDVTNVVKGYPHQAFKDNSGTTVVETYTITGMGHGTPVDPGNGTDRCGTAAPFVIDTNICSSFFIAKFWGIAE